MWQPVIRMYIYIYLVRALLRPPISTAATAAAVGPYKMHANEYNHGINLFLWLGANNVHKFKNRRAGNMPIDEASSVWSARRVHSNYEIEAPILADTSQFSNENSIEYNSNHMQWLWLFDGPVRQNECVSERRQHITNGKRADIVVVTMRWTQKR